MYRWNRFLWLCGALILLVACGANNRVIYNVSGPDGGSAIVRYMEGGKEQQEDIKLPWQKEVAYNAGETLTITSDNTTHTDKIRCSITLIGQTTPVSTAEDIDQAVCSYKP